MNWKYALIKIDYPGLWETDGDYCELVELYLDDNNEYTSFCKARVNSLEELENAIKDVKRDGINTWFSDNGVFSWRKEDKFWDWKRNK